MGYEFIKTVDELILLDLQNCYFRHWRPSIVPSPDAGGTVIGLLHSKLMKSPNIILVGKPVIAAFMGVSEKTLKRWFVKYPGLPVQREKYRCYALINNLIIWAIQSELDKLDSNLVKKAKYIAMSEQHGVCLEHFMKNYVYKSQYRDEPNKSRLRTKKHYKKTVDRVVSMVKTQMHLQWSALTDLDGNICGIPLINAPKNI